jgi:hypothetical protein
MFCSDADSNGECLTYGSGDYASLPLELNNSISSGRRISQRYLYNQNPTWSGGDLSYRPGPTDIRQR